MSTKVEKESQNSDDEMPVEKFKSLVNEHLKRELEENIRTLADKVMNEYKLSELKKTNGNYQTLNRNAQPVRRKPQADGIPPDKVFVSRNSLLTELFEISHIRTIHHIFIVTLIILFMNTAIFDFLHTGRINIGLHLMRKGFGKMSIVVPLWITMQIAVLLPYFLLCQWAKVRIILRKTSGLQTFWDVSILLAFIGFQCGLLFYAVLVIFKYQLPMTSGFILLFESVRLVMKCHAFVRTVSPRALDNKSSVKDVTARLPQLSSYTYFLFAPTLVYRDSYPRTGHIKWKRFFLRLTEFLMTIFYFSFVVDRFLLPVWTDFGQPDTVLRIEQVVLAVFSCMLPGLVIFVCGFYMLLHCWLNATSELFTFADRRFYMDWWNQSRFSAYYRTWNIVVGDWLYTYIYRDAILITGNRFFAQILVFSVSALIHELILAVGFGFFYPVMLIMFGFFGVFLIFLTDKAHPKVGNIFMWWSLATGNGILWSLYSMEYFSRQNCPSQFDSALIDFFVPRSWSCQKITLSPDWQFQNPWQV